MKIRRLVTQNDPAGLSSILSDQELGEGLQNIELWHEAAQGSASGTPSLVPFYPTPGSSIFRVVVLPPETVMTSAEMAELSQTFFSALNIPECRVDTSRHPLMHRTPTVDYVVVLCGQVDLILDKGAPVRLTPLDSVVQRGTNHAWSNPGPDELGMLVVMLPSTA